MLRFRLGRLTPKEGEYDVVIVGGGPAGLTAAIYCSRYRLKTLVVTDVPGGRNLSSAGYIENYPGLKRVRGPELAKMLVEHAVEAGAQIETDVVIDIKRLEDGRFEVLTQSGARYVAKAVIIAVGASTKRAGIPGEEKFVGRGVSYCASCDAPFFKDKKVAIIGFGNEAANEALLLAEYASKVYLICKLPKLGADPAYEEKIASNTKIEVLPNTRPKEILGDTKVKAIKVITADGTEKTLEVDGVFIAEGNIPTNFLKKLGLELDEEGYVIVKPDQSTNIKGIFAAGDITTASNKFRQIITAAAEGAIAAKTAYTYIKTQTKT